MGENDIHEDEHVDPMGNTDSKKQPVLLASRIGGNLPLANFEKARPYLILIEELLDDLEELAKDFPSNVARTLHSLMIFLQLLVFSLENNPEYSVITIKYCVDRCRVILSKLVKDNEAHRDDTLLEALTIVRTIEVVLTHAINKFIQTIVLDGKNDDESSELIRITFVKNWIFENEVDTSATVKTLSIVIDELGYDSMKVSSKWEILNNSNDLSLQLSKEFTIYMLEWVKMEECVSFAIDNGLYSDKTDLNNEGEAARTRIRLAAKNGKIMHDPDQKKYELGSFWRWLIRELEK